MSTSCIAIHIPMCLSLKISPRSYARSSLRGNGRQRGRSIPKPYPYKVATMLFDVGEGACAQLLQSVSGCSRRFWKLLVQIRVVRSKLIIVSIYKYDLFYALYTVE